MLMVSKASRGQSPADLTLKFAGVLLLCAMFRLLPRPPDVEPVMTGLTPLGRKLGALAGGLFGVLAVLVYDVAAGQVGPWTVATASCYGLVGLAGGLWLSSRKNPGILDYGAFAIAGTLFYDSVTALAFGSFFGYSLPVIVAGQVPFTLMHLATNVFGVLFISPLLGRYVVDNESLSLSGLLEQLAQVSA
jgi:uncharacterized membrane protein YuzA (DUF378 family)